MKQTAVEWLIKIYLQTNKIDSFDIEQAKAMEKEQIIDAFVECWKENMPEGYECKQSAEYYYNETFKKDYTQCQKDMADKWISVEDRLPEESGRYLGYLKELKDLGNSFSIINVAFNTNHKDSTAWTEQGEVLQYITHWMPLPNKPLNKQE